MGTVFIIQSFVAAAPVVPLPRIVSVSLPPAVEEITPPSTLTLDEIQSLVRDKAKKYGVRFDSLFQTILCEAPRTKDGLFDPTGQSKYKDEKGDLEGSWGLVQIHLVSHTEITKAQALDPDWSIDWMAKQFAAGNAYMWTCWQELKESGKI